MLGQADIPIDQAPDRKRSRSLIARPCDTEGERNGPCSILQRIDLVFFGRRIDLVAMAIAAAATATVTMALARPTSNVLLTRHRARWVFTPFAVSSSFTSSSSSSKPSRALILYSKPGCCLCDGLKEKLQAAFLLAGPDSLQDVDLQVTP